MNMCDFFWQRMENSSNQGDLADIVRASRQASTTDLHLPPSSPSPFPPTTLTPIDDFIDPFSNLRDPLLHEFVGAPLFDGLDPGPTAVGSADMAPGETMKRPLNVFSRMLQISPGAIKPRPIIADGMEGCPVQIPSPRTTPGIKRRKGQAKKVVCIPAPAAASSRPGGEVVPSDLWAWRKYGQKPIKGSPYPRGYYRCSSSKGCSARKQVERSRTDPNMLVITYTSEHNHPWPTQRNALAGSTRSQPSKNLSSTSKASPHNQRPPTSLKEEHKEMMNPIMQLIKEEATEIDKGAIDFTGNHEFDQVFHQYKPMIPDSNQPDDFFADLPELEPDPMSLIFSKEFMGAKSDEDHKALDAFNMFNWAAESSSGDPRKDL